MLAMMAIPLFVYAVNIKLKILVVHLCHIPYALACACTPSQETPWQKHVSYLEPNDKFGFIKKEALAQVFSCEFCEISKNTFFTEHVWVTVFENVVVDKEARRRFISILLL